MSQNAENDATPKVTFYRSWVAFPFIKRDGRPDEIMVSVEPAEGEASNYEFGIEHVGTEPRYREPIALRVQLFADSWRAFTDLPEFFALLASLDESGPSRHRSEKVSLDDLTPRLLALGWTDITPKYARQHEHFYVCDCGERGRPPKRTTQPRATTQPTAEPTP